jgi:hypothetical protein
LSAAGLSVRPPSTIPKTPPITPIIAYSLGFGTGKSSLTVQYVDGHFVDSYYPTIENTFSKVIRYRNQDFATEIIDTAGQDEYTILNSKHFIGIHGYMIVYSVASKQSFEMVRIIRDKILNHLVRSFARVLSWIESSGSWASPGISKITRAHGLPDHPLVNWSHHHAALGYLIPTPLCPMNLLLAMPHANNVMFLCRAPTTYP